MSTFELPGPQGATPVREVNRSDLDALHEFLDEGVIDQVSVPLKSGKEATVYLCRAAPGVGPEWVAAKVFKETRFRDFADSTAYTEGRVITKRRERVAMEKKTPAGRTISAAFWVNREFDVLSELFEAGADVPEPFFCTERAIVMEFVGNGDRPAPQLQHARPAPDRAPGVRERLLRNVELFLDCHVVHADLSPFNVLACDDRYVVIDFPQAVDARTNPHAREFLERDLRNILRFFDRTARNEDASERTTNLWGRYRDGDLGWRSPRHL